MSEKELSVRYGSGPLPDMNQDADVKVPLRRDSIAFFLCGLLNNFGYVVFLSAAEDLVPDHSGAVLLANILPTLCIKLTAPLFMQRIPYSYRVCFSVFCALLSFQLVAWPRTIPIKLLGVCFASVSSGFGEITFLALTTRYHKNAISAWSSGTGGAGIAGSLSYLAMTQWIGWSEKTALLVVSPANLMVIVSFFFIMSKPHSPGAKSAPQLALEEEQHIINHSVDSYLQETPTGYMKQQTKRSWRDTYLAIKGLLPFMIPLFFVYMFEYAILQGINPSIVFSNLTKCPYTTYQFLYQVGVFISRSSRNFLAIRKVWLLAILQALNFIFLLFEAYYQFIPSVIIVYILTAWIGLLGGATYVNTMYEITESFDPKNVEFVMGVVSVADDIGISVAATMSLGLEPWLSGHNPLVAALCHHSTGSS
eukprot:TRINITY_DN1588_c0_g1_i1.p1 TRINITY_DN1588_c0_g1~~TRINITY_DN1588_c0_g1_i1.p1  ORF type:complete len:422 (-),score=80.63 TRINITY_DN1588_c0_g1_i1:81-1346(-)